MRPKGSADLIVYRRRQALKLFDEGKSLNETGKIVGCNAASVMRWRDTRSKHGDKVFEVRALLCLSINLVTVGLLFAESWILR